MCCIPAVVALYIARSVSLFLLTSFHLHSVNASNRYSIEKQMEKTKRSANVCRNIYLLTYICTSSVHKTQIVALILVVLFYKSWPSQY